MNAKGSWNRIFAFAALCIVIDALVVAILGGGAFTALITTFAVGAGYAAGGFQMLRAYKKDMETAIQSLNLPEKEKV